MDPPSHPSFSFLMNHPPPEPPSRSSSGSSTSYLDVLSLAPPSFTLSDHQLGGYTYQKQSTIEGGKTDFPTTTFFHKSLPVLPPYSRELASPIEKDDRGEEYDPYDERSLYSGACTYHLNLFSLNIK